MKLTFLGATHEVTGSCTYLEAAGCHILIDCGMEQGPDEFENQSIPINPALIDFVLLTHAHIDHSGNLPLLYKNGFRGRVHSTTATKDLCDIMLRDSAHIQMFEAEWRNRKGKRSGDREFVPLYDMDDALGVIAAFTPHRYDNRETLCEGVDVRFTDVGHLLGSSCIEIWITEGGQTRKIVFSGDIGNKNQPLLHDPHFVEEADFVVMESTYGDRDHKAEPDYVGELAAVIQRTFDRGGNVVIPSFAVGRTQELLYFIRRIKADGLVRGHGDFPVYVDSPLAIEATQVFGKNVLECLDDEALSLVRNGINPIGFSGLRVSVSSDESKAINFSKESKVIISASGMCDAGRIKHHLKHNLWRPECTVLFVGYQAAGSVGRSIIEGARQIKLFGEPIEIHAEICRLQGISGHADRLGLLEWIGSYKTPLRHVFVLHGDPAVVVPFTELLKSSLHLSASAPYSGSEYDMLEERWIFEAAPVPIRKKSLQPHVSDALARLNAAGARLLAVIRKNSGSSNKDLARFTDQINSLCEKWER